MDDNFRPMPYELPGVKLSDISHVSKERQSNVSVEADNEYVVIDQTEYDQAYEEVRVPLAPHPKQEQQQSSSTDDYELVQCRAYIPVTHGNQQTETTLTQPSTAVVAAARDTDQGMSEDDDHDKKDSEAYEYVYPG